MRTDSLIAAITAAAIAAGTLAVSTTAASAYSPANLEGQRYAIVFKSKHDDLRGWEAPKFGISQEGFLVNLGGREVCSPIYGQEWGWDTFKGRRTLETVKVGETCEWLPEGVAASW
jgi:hypothetical protein